MASFNNIASSILAKVIRLLINDKTYYMESWKKKLPIAAVCSRWRELALPLIFNQVYFIDSDVYWATKRKTVPYEKDSDQFDQSEPKNAHLVTNVDLFKVNNRCYLAEDLFINFNECGDQITLLTQLLGILQQHRGEWTGIKNIFLNSVDLAGISNKKYSYILSDSDILVYIVNGLPSFVNFMSKHFTSVRFIEHPYSKDLIAVFSTMLLQSYADQLSYIPGEFYLVSHLKYLPQHITNLDLNLYDSHETMILPVIIAETLKDLQLTNVSPYFDWTCFENLLHPYNNNICFKNLEYLHIFYRLGNYYTYPDERELSYPHDRFKFKMIFPKLNELRIQHCSRNNSLLHADFPNKVSKVWFTGSNVSISLCQLMQIKVRYSIYDFTNEIDEDPETYILASRFPNNNKTNKISLAFEQLDKDDLPITQSQWPLVESLNIKKLFVDNLENILASLNNLKFLIIRMMDGYQLLHRLKDPVFFRFASSSHFQRYNSIMQVFIAKSAFENPDDMCILIKFFLVTCPNLRYIYADIKFKNDLETFIDDYKAILAYLNSSVIDYH